MAGRYHSPQTGERPGSGQLADELRMLGVRDEERVAVTELEVGEVEAGRDDAADERPGVVRRQVRAAREAGALPAAGRHQRLREPARHAPRGRRARAAATHHPARSSPARAAGHPGTPRARRSSDDGGGSRTPRSRGRGWPWRPDGRRAACAASAPRGTSPGSTRPQGAAPSRAWRPSVRRSVACRQHTRARTPRPRSRLTGAASVAPPPAFAADRMLPPKGVLIQLTSYTFLFAFLPVTLLVYWLLPRAVWRLAFLVLASWVFVGWYDWRFVPIMIGATTIDWVAGAAAGARRDAAPPPLDPRRRARRQRRHPRLLQVPRLLPRLARRPRLLGGPRPRPAGPARAPAARHLVLHVQRHELRDRRLPRRRDRDAELPALRGVHRPVPARHRRADPALAGRGGRLRRQAAPPDDASGGARPVLHRLRHGQEAAHRRRDAAARGRALRQRRPPPLLQRVGGRPRLHPPALLRLQRLLGHGGRPRLPARLPLPAELRLAVQGRQPEPVLAPLAHDAVVLVARLPLHPARRLAPRHRRHGAQPDADLSPRRPLARRRVDVHRLGPAARHLPVGARGGAQDEA